MIAHIDRKYISSRAPKWIAALISRIASNHHYVDCDDETRRVIEQSVSRHCGTIDKELCRNSALYDITALKRKYLTTIQVDGSLSETCYCNIFGLPSLVLLENANYEWPIYRMMIDAYKNDRDYKNIFAILKRSVDDYALKSEQAGGNSQLLASIKFKEEGEYKGLTRYKIYTVTDSDLDSVNAQYQGIHNTLYRELCGITDLNANVDRSNIDVINQPYYHWHMWRKRAIENYFPPEAYEKFGLNADNYKNNPIPQRNYIKVDKKVVIGYEKKDLQNIAKSMGRMDYENVSDKLIVEGKEMSEIRLFLLKMAKVV